MYMYGVGRGERDREREKDGEGEGKGERYMIILYFFSYSDSEQESDVMAAIGQLSQRLAKQKEEIDQLRMDQHVQFQALTEKLDGLAQALIGAQRTSLAEHAKEQRILLYNKLSV